MSSILTTHLVVGSFFGHPTFIAKRRTPRRYRKSFRQLPQLQSMTTPLGSSGRDLSSSSYSDIKRSATRCHARHFSPAASPKRQCLRACGPTFGDGSPPIASPATDLSPYHLASPLWCWKMPFVPIFLSDECF